MKTPLTYIDLFAGAGGLSEGFIRAGYKPIAHVEMDEAACYTLKTRTAYHYLKTKKQFGEYVKYLKGEIDRTALYSLIPEDEMNIVINLALGDENNAAIFKKIDARLKDNVDLIIGGPPCQAYSLVGRARSKNGMIDDPRNHLYLQYAKYLKRFHPKMFVFENVLGLRSADGGEYLIKMKAEFKRVGYETKEFLFNASDFGVLQNRKRIIMVGYQKDSCIIIPDIKPAFDKRFLVQSIFQDLPKLQAGEGKDRDNEITYATETNEYLNAAHIRNGLEVLTQHVSRPHTIQDKEIYRIAVNLMRDGDRLNYLNLPEELKTHRNQHSFFDRFKVVNATALAAQTVVAHIAKDGHYYIHPDIKQNRSISIREAARLQSFPDDFYFEGVKEGRNRTASFKQIGNAVPPLMALEIAKIIKKIL